jgi:DNA-binding IclR family transcriptional regulator
MALASAAEAAAPPTSVIGRNLLVLQALAGMFRVSLGDLSARTGLTQSTAHRILANLINAGLVAKDGRPGEYRLTSALGRIGRMVDDRIMILDAVEDAARALTLSRDWPVAVGFLERGQMVVTFTTRALTTLTLKPSTLYERLDLTSAMGQAALASMTPERCANELDALADFAPGTEKRISLERKIALARSRGYGLRMTGRAGTSSVAVDLNFGGGTIGALVSTVFQKVAAQDLMQSLARDLKRIRSEAEASLRQVDVFPSPTPHAA